MQDGTYCPVFLQSGYGQSFKQFSLALEIGFQSRNQQAFPETARRTEEVITAGLYHFVDQGRLVNIEIAFLAEFLEILDTDGIYLITHKLLFFIG